MTVHVISVGRSVLERLDDPAGTPTGHSEADAEVRQRKPQKQFDSYAPDQASDWIASALSPGSQDANAAALAEVARAIRPDLWPADMSAEVATFRRLPDIRRFLPVTDIALLICSDTSEGLLAGLWNAAALTGNKLDRVAYLADPKTNPGVVRGKVVITRVAGMNAATRDGFATAMKGLGALGRHVLRSGDVEDSERFCFYLSGGYKAAIPYLIGLAEGVRSLNPERPVSAFVLHESATEKTGLIQLPLRYLPAERVRYELSKFDENGKGTEVPEEGVLEGYAYELEGRKYRLNAFGAGLVTLFGLDTIGLPG